LEPLCLFSQKTQSINLKIVNKIVPTIHAHLPLAWALDRERRRKNPDEEGEDSTSTLLES
jgi:hypothetical protein